MGDDFGASPLPAPSRTPHPKLPNCVRFPLSPLQAATRSTKTNERESEMRCRSAMGGGWGVVRARLCAPAHHLPLLDATGGRRPTKSSVRLQSGVAVGPGGDATPPAHPTWSDLAPRLKFLCASLFDARSASASRACARDGGGGALRRRLTTISSFFARAAKTDGFGGCAWTADRSQEQFLSCPFHLCQQKPILPFLPYV